ncbi:MAG: winged helix-turn-helix domain-containing protein [Patescibacteria group bacterium]
MASHTDPFNQKTFNNLFLPWIQVINQNESGVILHVPKRDQNYHVKQFLEAIPFLSASISAFSQIQIITIDLGALALDDLFDVKNYIDSRLLKNKRPVLLILDADILLLEKPNLLSFFDRQYHEINASVLYFFSRNILYDKYVSNLNQYTTLFQNIIVLPYFEPEETRYFLTQREKQFCTLTKPIKDKILKYCGGCLWLIKEALRHYCRTIDERELFTHQEMITKLQILLNEMEPEEREILHQITLQDFYFTKQQKPYLTYLKQTKTVIQKGENYYIAIPLIEEMIRREGEMNNRLSIGKNNSIELNKVPIDLVFSRGEKKLMIVFVEHPNKVISREKTAEILWGSKNKEVYTDWALDQAMWRLRKKCMNLKLSRKIIQTVKNKGFIYKKHG